jgi:hypothetical protein
MRKKNNYVLIIAGMCVLSSGVAFSLHQPTRLSLSDKTLAKITVGCSKYLCFMPNCTQYTTSCSTIGGGDYCIREIGYQGRVDATCSLSGYGLWEKCLMKNLELCSTIYTYEKFEGSCSPGPGGSCQGRQISSMHNNEHQWCGEVTW